MSSAHITINPFLSGPLSGPGAATMAATQNALVASSTTADPSASSITSAAALPASAVVIALSTGVYKGPGLGAAAQGSSVVAASQASVVVAAAPPSTNAEIVWLNKIPPQDRGHFSKFMQTDFWLLIKDEYDNHQSAKLASLLDKLSQYGSEREAGKLARAATVAEALLCKLSPGQQQELGKELMEKHMNQLLSRGANGLLHFLDNKWSKATEPLRACFFSSSCRPLIYNVFYMFCDDKLCDQSSVETFSGGIKLICELRNDDLLASAYSGYLQSPFRTSMGGVDSYDTVWIEIMGAARTASIIRRPDIALALPLPSDPWR